MNADVLVLHLHPRFFTRIFNGVLSFVVLKPNNILILRTRGNVYVLRDYGAFTTISPEFRYFTTCAAIIVVIARFVHCLLGG
jgi:hypothetical protein